MSQNIKESSHIALFVPYGEFTILPSVVNSAQVLADNGFFVDIIAIASDRFGSMPGHHFDTDKIRVTYYQPAGPGRLTIFGWYFRVQELAKLFLQIGGSTKYRCLFGIDAEGLMAATLAGNKLGVPVIYYSLEIELAGGEWRLFFKALRQRHSPILVLLRRFLKNRLNAWFKKPWERRAHRQASLTIALDEERGQALLRDNRQTHAKMLIVPTSPIGLRHIPDRQYLRRKYNLAADRKLLLQIGGISDVARTLELAKSVKDWPEEWTLILHGFTSDEHYLSQVRALADGNRIILSTDLVPYNVLDDLVSSADLGLALYKAIDLNYLHMASGKLLHYLKCGLPVIATDFPNLRHIFEDNQCGICISDETEIVSAARRIFSDHDYWSANAQRCFDEEFEFTRSFQAVLTCIEKL
jgi:glycosyltransferase involved in cell wall biosynthesis